MLGVFKPILLFPALRNATLTFPCSEYRHCPQRFRRGCDATLCEALQLYPPEEKGFWKQVAAKPRSIHQPQLPSVLPYGSACKRSQPALRRIASTCAAHSYSYHEAFGWISKERNTLLGLRYSKFALEITELAPQSTCRTAVGEQTGSDGENWKRGKRTSRRLGVNYKTFHKRQVRAFLAGMADLPQASQRTEKQKARTRSQIFVGRPTPRHSKVQLQACTPRQG